MTDADAVAAEFEDLASWCEGSSPLYQRLCEIAAEDEVLLDVAADHTPGQPAPQLLLAAVQDRLFVESASDDESDPHGDLAAYYGSVTDDPRPPDGALADAFRGFVREHESAIRDLVSTRRVQTNAVRRCSGLYPSFATIADRVDGDALALLEVGASAGLNLNWDRYQYAYRRRIDGSGRGRDESGDVRRVGRSDSPVNIETELREDGEPPLPDDPPAVADRVGLDLHPLDPTDDADARWLRALVWPEHHDRRPVLDDALEATREHPPDVVAGDAVDDLQDVADRLPADQPLVVFHTLVLYQFDEDARDAFRDAVRDLAATRDAPTFRLAGERSDPDRDNGIQLRLARIGDPAPEDGTEEGDGEVDTLGTFEQHGAWIAWRDGAGDRSRSDSDDVIHEDVTDS